MRNEGDCQGIQSRLWCARDAAQNGLFSMLSAFPNKIKRLRVERDAPFGRHLSAYLIGALVERDLRLSGGLGRTLRLRIPVACGRGLRSAGALPRKSENYYGLRRD